ncbi:MAG: Re/Si-specific NAD(P)(+) transhydrogenase subunit alpha [Alphaproteobacteria bacterium]|jgi:H+-translocating NAD(P) transhydrogenase subunit alpha|nr:Re/Si-specific NAD(P)(+) transhydrogenase subunit alpha [Alphaproteobacteria bacterium]
MILGSVNDSDIVEKRIPISPDTIKKYIASGFSVQVEKDFGKNSNIQDVELQNLGAKVLNKEEIYKTSDILIKINCPSDSEISLMKEGSVLIGSFFPHLNKDKINKLLKKNIKIFSLELLPRITRAQSMDILSSQANLAGYKAVIDSVYEFNRAVPMMMTAAGTITPAKFFIIGAGVAGLQAIATAKRLGGVVSATDVRSASKEQVESLGGKFVFVESAKNLETSGGYAKELDEDDKKKQEELLKTTIKTQDIIICTALIPGKKAPRIVSEEMVKSMKSGSVICDLAVEQGGNSAFSEPGKVNVVNGVKIIGYKNFPGRISESASTLFAKNILNFLEIIYDKVEKKLKIDENDEIVKAVYVNKEVV